MSATDAAYDLLEALAHLISEMEVLVDACNADEAVAVLECVTDLRRCLNEGHALLAGYAPQEDDDGDFN